MSLPPVLADAIEALGEEDGSKVLEAVNDFRVPAERIANALREVGHPVGASTIRTYRRCKLAQSVVRS